MIISDLDILEDLCDESSVIGGFRKFRGSLAKAEGAAIAVGENTYTSVSGFTLTTPNAAKATVKSVSVATNDNDDSDDNGEIA